MASKSKSTDHFVPELDGAGRVFCPVDQKALKRINTNPSSGVLAQALKAALEKKAGVQ